MSLAGPLTQTATDAIARAAHELGFCRIGFASAEPFTRAREQLTAWLSRGYAGNLNYLASDDRADPSALLPGVKTIVAVALAYGRPPAKARDESGLAGRVARYAQGEDYHLVVRDKLVLLAERCREILGPELGTRVCVDTAPLLEHEAARAAGLGFTAKSTLTIVPGAGSMVVLGELLLDVTLPPSAPVTAGCGSCRACLDACPTGAFVDAFVLDARRCISYLTIEHQGPIPREFRRPIGMRVDSGPATGQEVVVTERALIGGADQVTLKLTGLSPHHLEVVAHGNAFFARDLSGGSTFRSGAPLGSEFVELSHGDLLLLSGAVLLRFEELT
jgi:epoxyqueuosine reductase